MKANAHYQRLEANAFHQAPETKKHGDICNQPPFSFTTLHAVRTGRHLLTFYINRAAVK